MLTPTQAFVNAAHDERNITDARGRVLTIRRLTTVDRLRLFKAVGPTLASNDRYLGIATLAFTVQAIDGVPLPQPANENQIEAALLRIGDDGIEAIGASLIDEQDEGLAAADSGN